MGTLSKDDLGNLKYVIIEVELHRQSADKIVGYFMGYRPLAHENLAIASKDEMFLWLSKGEHIHLISLEHYKLSIIRVGTGVVNTRILCTDSWAKASIVAELYEIVEELKKRNWVDETGLIDVNKYTDVSRALKEEVEGINYAPQQQQPVYGHNRSGAQYSGSTVLYPKKEVHTSTLKRTSKYNASEAIDAMKAKVQAIRDGKYEPPKLKDMPKDKEESEEKKDAQPSSPVATDGQKSSDEDELTACCFG